MLKNTQAKPAADQRLIALQMMKDSLKLLDASGAKADVGAHLDMAICRLESELGAAAND